MGEKMLITVSGSTEGMNKILVRKTQTISGASLLMIQRSKNPNSYRSVMLEIIIEGRNAFLNLKSNGMHTQIPLDDDEVFTVGDDEFHVDVARPRSSLPAQ